MHKYIVEVKLQQNEYLTDFFSFPIFIFEKNINVSCCANTKGDAIEMVNTFLKIMGDKGTKFEILSCHLFSKKYYGIKVNYSVGKKSYKHYVDFESIEEN